MKVREIALNIINSISKNKSFSNIELNKAIRENSLNDADKALLTRIVYGTIKEFVILDYEINKATDNKSIKPLVRDLLRMSLYQMRYMDRVPTYAIINEAVEIAKKVQGSMTANFVNAVLRRLSFDLFTPSKLDYKDELDYISILNSIPSWITHMISKQYTKEDALTYIKSSKLDSPISLRVNTLKANLDDLLKKDYFVKSSLSPVGLIYTNDKSLNELEEFMNGEVFVQGESSQLVPLLLNPKENDCILDMCAAPGGKTYGISALLNNSGKVYSVDLYDHRIKLLENNLPRLGIKNVKTIVGDSRKLSMFKDNTFDKILLDAPCSGLGIIRRKPDIIYNIKQDDIDSLIALQRELIDEAYRLLKNGGELVYSTCTIDKKENDGQVKYMLDKYKDLELVESKTLLPTEEIVDGFFMAKLKKR